MTLIHAACRVAGGVLFTLFLIGFVMLHGVSQFTEYGNLQPAVTGAMLSRMPSMSASEFSAAKSDALAYCQKTGAEAFNLADARPGLPNATIRCADVAAAGGPDELRQILAAGVFDYVYYKDYACGFFDCLSQLHDQELAMMMVSGHAHEFFKSMMALSVAGIMAGLALMAYGIRRLFPVVRAVGIEMSIAGAASLAVSKVAEGAVPVEAAVNEAIAPLISGLFDTLSGGFAVVLAVGVVVAAAGFIGSRGRKEKRRK